MVQSEQFLPLSKQCHSGKISAAGENFLREKSIVFAICGFRFFFCILQSKNWVYMPIEPLQKLFPSLMPRNSKTLATKVNSTLPKLFQPKNIKWHTFAHKSWMSSTQLLGCLKSPPGVSLVDLSHLSAKVGSHERKRIRFFRSTTWSRESSASKTRVYCFKRKRLRGVRFLQSQLVFCVQSLYSKGITGIEEAADIILSFNGEVWKDTRCKTTRFSFCNFTKKSQIK